MSRQGYTRHWKFLRLMAALPASTFAIRITMTSQAVLEVQSTSAQPRMEIDVAREKTFINSALLHEALEIGINEGNVLHYTAGWVAFKLKRRLEKLCSNCTCALVALSTEISSNPVAKLIEVKNYGGLSVPSSSLFALLCAAQQHFRSCMAVQDFSNCIVQQHLAQNKVPWEFCDESKPPC